VTQFVASSLVHYRRKISLSRLLIRCFDIDSFLTSMFDSILIRCTLNCLDLFHSRPMLVRKVRLQGWNPCSWPAEPSPDKWRSEWNETPKERSTTIRNQPESE